MRIQTGFVQRHLKIGQNSNVFSPVQTIYSRVSTKNEIFLRRKQREKKGKKGEKETRYFSFLFSFTCDTSKMCAGELIFKEAIFFLSYEYYEERDVFLPPRYNMCVCGDVVSFFLACRRRNALFLSLYRTSSPSPPSTRRFSRCSSRCFSCWCSSLASSSSSSSRTSCNAARNTFWCSKTMESLTFFTF